MHGTFYHVTLLERRIVQFHIERKRLRPFLHCMNQFFGRFVILFLEHVAFAAACQVEQALEQHVSPLCLALLVVEQVASVVLDGVVSFTEFI